MDDIILQNFDYIQTENRTILMSEDIKWLNYLQLNHSICYVKDDLALFFHYCQDESRYPILYDKQCVPNSVDLYEKLIYSNQTKVSQYVKDFVIFFNKFIKNSVGLKSRLEIELNRALSYAKKIGRDCEHPEVWWRNFDPMLPSSHDDHELWELYCLHRIRYPNLVSVNSGKYYVPGYYYERIQNDQLTPDEKWMSKWMEEKFLPYYETNWILRTRYQNELNHSQNYAKKNGLNC